MNKPVNQLRTDATREQVTEPGELSIELRNVAKRECTTNDAGLGMTRAALTMLAASFLSIIKGVKHTLQKRPVNALQQGTRDPSTPYFFSSRRIALVTAVI